MAAAGIPSSVANHVPHYDIFGHQHHREPFKDKSHLLKEDIRHPRWLGEPPAVRTRPELKQAQFRARNPDISYDFDGDGVVGPLDHFIGRSFDKDHDGRISTAERREAQQALDNGFLDKFVRGLDSAGQARGFAVQQRRGQIMMADNTQDASRFTYPPHHNADMQPPHNTRTALHLSRLSEARAAGAALGERCARESAPVDEPQPPNHRTQPRVCPISRISERVEADHQESRLRAGLLATSTAVNPEREAKTVGLDHVEQPYFGTRSQLLETRKELMKRECEELALKAEDYHVPLSVRRAEKEVREFEFRRPDHMPMTLTRLKDDRRKEKIEHDMRHFCLPRVGPREYPRFSDNPEVPFWLADGGGGGGQRALGATAPAPAMSRTVSEPVLKVTDVPWGHAVARESAADFPEAAHTMAAAGKKASAEGDRIGSKTVKRWTAEYIERGEGRNKPRLFDSVQPVRIGPKDLESLDITSSMEPIRNAALHRRTEENKKNAGVPKRSRLWCDPSQAPPAPPPGGAHGGDLDGGAGGAGGAKGLRGGGRSLVQSEPALRGAAMIERDAPTDPRFFGSAAHIARPSSQTAIRCGGFQRLQAAERHGGHGQRPGRSSRVGDQVPSPQ